MNSILCCFSKIFCCCGPKPIAQMDSKVEPAIEEVKPSCSMVHTDPSNIPRITPPEGFDHFYPYGTVFPGEDKTPHPKEILCEELTGTDHITLRITRNGASADVEMISEEDSFKAGSTGKL